MSLTGNYNCRWTVEIGKKQITVQNSWFLRILRTDSLLPALYTQKTKILSNAIVFDKCKELSPNARLPGSTMVTCDMLAQQRSLEGIQRHIKKNSLEKVFSLELKGYRRFTGNINLLSIGLLVILSYAFYMMGKKYSINKLTLAGLVILYLFITFGLINNVLRMPQIQYLLPEHFFLFSIIIFMLFKKVNTKFHMARGENETSA